MWACSFEAGYRFSRATVTGSVAAFWCFHFWSDTAPNDVPSSLRLNSCLHTCSRTARHAGVRAPAALRTRDYGAPAWVL